jgi:hypothetical protein
MSRTALGAALGVLVGFGIAVAVVPLFDESGSCPGGPNSPTPVLVAKRLIPEGTSWSTIVERRMYVPTTLPCAERKPGAVADPADLAGTVTVVDLFPGQQLTDADFESR